MDGNFYRGEIYNMRMDGGWGSEEAASRPAVIISNDRGNEKCPTVMCAMLTTQFKYGAINVETLSSGRRSWIMCNQLKTLDKARAIKYLGSLNDEELASLEKGLMIAMSLNGDYDETEIENLEAEISEKDATIKKLEARIEEVEAEISEKDAELEKQIAESIHSDMWEKLYKKALEELVSVKMTGDIDRLMKEKASVVSAAVVAEVPEVKAPVEKAPEVKVAPVEAEPVKPEINTCTEADLKKIGCSALVAHSIVANRPYKAVDDLRRVPYLVTVTHKLIKDKVVCVPVVEKTTEEKPSGKLNINTATVEDMERIGISPKTAQMIRAYRNKNGKFKSLDELLNVPRWGNGCALKYGPMLEV